MVGLHEYMLLIKKDNDKHLPLYFYFAGIMVYAIVGLSGLGIIDIRSNALIFVILFVQIIADMLNKRTGSDWKIISQKITGIIYISLPLGLMNSLFYFGGVDKVRISLILGLFILTWTSDVMAYLTGSLFGKHKLFERISPKKTWEGSIGGLLFALVAAFILSIFFTDISLIRWLVIAVVIVISGTLGDLAESLLKRNAGVKDSGKIFPGHGGVLDRLDAVIFATPMVFVTINLF